MELFCMGSAEYSLEQNGRGLSLSFIGEKLTPGYTELFSLMVEGILLVLGSKGKARELCSDLRDAVDMYHLSDVQRGAGSMMVTRTVFGEVLQRLHGSDGEELHGLWRDQGRWDG